MRSNSPNKVVGELLVENGIIKLTFANGDVVEVQEKTSGKKVEYTVPSDLTIERQSAIAAYFQNEVKKSGKKSKKVVDAPQPTSYSTNMDCNNASPKTPKVSTMSVSKAAKKSPVKVSARAQVNAYFVKELPKKVSKTNPSGMGDTAWRKHVLAEISVRFGLDESSAATAYNFAKKKAVAEGLVEDFGRSGKEAGILKLVPVPKAAAKKAAAKATAKPAAKATAKPAAKKAAAKAA